MQPRLPLVLLAFTFFSLPAPASDLPDAIEARGEILVATIAAVGSQVYECKPDPAVGTLSWQFREPIAALFISAKPWAAIMRDHIGS